MIFRPQRPTDAGRARFAALVMPHFESAYNLARWLVRDPHLTEDVVQESMVRALTYFATFKEANARAWLMQIVRNAAYTALAARGQKMRVETDLDDEAARAVVDPARDPEATLGGCQDAARLHVMLAGLPVELRECLVLRELEELSYKEIAQVTGVPIGTVMSRLWRARQSLIGEASGKATHAS